jgi:hypothetical protein
VGIDVIQVEPGSDRHFDQRRLRRRDLSLSAEVRQQIPTPIQERPSGRRPPINGGESPDLHPSFQRVQTRSGPVDSPRGIDRTMPFHQDFRALRVGIPEIVRGESGRRLRQVSVVESRSQEDTFP